jgi:hypothetical protein
MGRKHSGRATPARAGTAQRRRDALSLRAAGASFRQIADSLGISLGQAHADVVSELAEVTRPIAEEVLALDLERLDVMQVSLWPAVRAGDVQAVNAVARIVELRQKLVGNLRSVGVTVNTTPPPLPEGAVIMIGGSKSEYIAGLRAARGELPAPPAQNGNRSGHATPNEWTQYGGD